MCDMLRIVESRGGAFKLLHFFYKKKGDDDMKYKKRSYLDFKNLDRLTDTLANLLENISMAIDDKKPVRTKFNPEEFDKILRGKILK